MAIRIAASISDADLIKVRFQLRGIDDGAPRAISRALNAQAAKARTTGSQEIRKDVRLASAFVKERLSGPGQSQGNRATFTHLVAKVSAPSRPLVLSHFTDAKKTTVMQVGGRYVPVIQVKVKPTGSYKKIQDAFLIRLRRGEDSGDQWGIFVRENGKLKHLYGPSVSQVWRSEKDVIAPDMNAELALILDREVKNVLRVYA